MLAIERRRQILAALELDGNKIYIICYKKK